MSAIVQPDTFRKRFAVAVFEDGGVLVDVGNGNYFRLNRTAAAACAVLEQAETAAAATAALARRLDVSPPVAADHLRAITVDLSTLTGLRHEPFGPFRYHPARDGGHELSERNRPILRISADANTVTLLVSPSDLTFPMLDYVRAVAPKLFFLQGGVVLHGSGCRRGAGLVGLCGLSGAGKTTTARSLAAHGWPLVSEDLLVMGPDPAQPVVYLEGEAAIHGWAASTAQAFVSRHRTVVDATPLQAAAYGPTIPLEAIWFVDAGRRREALSVRPIGASDALVYLLESNFLGGADEARWRRHLAVSRAICSAIPGCELEVPAGLERLDQAARSYITNSAS